MNARVPFAIRALDLVGALAGLVVTSPVWVVISVAVKLDSAGPVLHRSLRVGQRERPFSMLKFRSMHPAAGPPITVAGDERVTRVGRLLRATKLDELPQLVNVLRGEMSLVGPRPEDPAYLDRMPDGLRAVFRYRPGMTSPASIRYRDEEQVLLRAGGGDPERYYVEHLLVEKAATDLAYFEGRRTVRSDLGILWATARCLWS